MRNVILFSAVSLIGQILLSPRLILRKIKDEGYNKEVLTIFFVAALITLIKSFFVKRKEFVFAFFDTELLNQIAIILDNSHIYWIILNISYFLFILLVYIVCKLFNRGNNFKQLVISLMSLGGVGIVAQGLFYILKIIFPHNIILFSSYIVYLWIFILSISAIKISQNISVPKALICFFIAALPFILFAYFVGMAPYLAWLTF